MDISRAHLYAIHDLLAAVTPDNIDVYLSKVTKGDAEIRFPYIVIWPSAAQRRNDSLAGYTGGNATTRHQITAAGVTPDEVLDVLDLVTATLQGKTPTIPGRDCGQIRMPEDQPPPIAVDPDHKTPQGWDIYFAVISVDLSSTAA